MAKAEVEATRQKKVETRLTAMSVAREQSEALLRVKAEEIKEAKRLAKQAAQEG